MKSPRVLQHVDVDLCQPRGPLAEISVSFPTPLTSPWRIPHPHLAIPLHSTLGEQKKGRHSFKGCFLILHGLIRHKNHRRKDSLL